jgi:hypothetical protein
MNIGFSLLHDKVPLVALLPTRASSPPHSSLAIDILISDRPRSRTTVNCSQSCCVTSQSTTWTGYVGPEPGSDARMVRMCFLYEWRQYRNGHDGKSLLIIIINHTVIRYLICLLNRLYFLITWCSGPQVSLIYRNKILVFPTSSYPSSSHLTSGDCDDSCPAICLPDSSALQQMNGSQQLTLGSHPAAPAWHQAHDELEGKPQQACPSVPEGTTAPFPGLRSHSAISQCTLRLRGGSVVK